jgi:hypothetical protein
VEAKIAIEKWCASGAHQLDLPACREPLPSCLM